MRADIKLIMKFYEGDVPYIQNKNIINICIYSLVSTQLSKQYVRSRNSMENLSQCMFQSIFFLSMLMATDFVYEKMLLNQPREVFSLGNIHTKSKFRSNFFFITEEYTSCERVDLN